MRLCALILAFWFAASSVNAQQIFPLANEELLYSARVWEARNRGDMARLALEKLVAARPNSPDALLELGELHLRMADIPSAQRVLEQLNSRFKDSDAALTFATELRVATRDRLELASVQRLNQIGRGREAKAALDKLFPDGAPDGSYGIEYYRLLADTPGGWERARDGLRRLATRRADDPRYRLALARHLLEREATQLEGVRMLHELSQRDDVRARDIEADLSSTLASLGYRRAPIDILRAYSTRHPEDAATARLLQQRLQIEAEQRLVLRLADAAANPNRQRSNLSDIIHALLAADAALKDFDRAIATLRALRNTTDDTRLDGATRAAIAWARRSVASAKTNEPRATLESQVAIAFAKNNFEAAIDLAERLEAVGAHDEAQELLATAGRLDPQSSWLFETQIRALLDAGDYDAAIRALETRSLSVRWTARDRDALLATAFDRRAEAAIAKNDVDQARADLTRAIELAPAYPWTRYQLAGLLSADGASERGRALMSEGVRLAPSNAEMRYAQALYLSSIKDDAAAFAAVDAIPTDDRTEGMQDLHGRLRVAIARSDAQRLALAGDLEAARARLQAVEALADNNLDRARDIANGWFDIGDGKRGLAVFERYRERTGDASVAAEFTWGNLLNRAEDARVNDSIEALKRRRDLDDEQRAAVVVLEREVDLRAIRALQREGRFAVATTRVDAMLAELPDDRALRIARAELALASDDPETARDLYSALVAEDPNDLDTRLDYVRALTESDDIDLARIQLEGAAEQAPATDLDMQMTIARRQLALGQANEAARTSEQILLAAPERADALMLAGRARLAARDYEGARSYFGRAERSPIHDTVTEARSARESIDARRRHWVETGIESRHKPGGSGVSEFDALIVPSLWTYGYDFERRFTLRADAVSVDAGTLSNDFDIAALFGTVQAAGPTAARPYRNDAQEGLGVGLIFSTELFAADVGTTPLGFLLPNVIGGFEWTPQWRGIDLALGIERRAITSSVLSYAGMRDPISGREWGGIVETGPYVGAGYYRERYSVSGSLRSTELNGKNVADNDYLGARIAGDWKFFANHHAQAFIGGVLNYWSYERNLQNYTFGHGGYYSPDSYVSFSIPLEVQGAWRGWTYRVRASLTFSDSSIEQAPFYPTDAALQAAAATAPLPSGFDSPIHDNEGSSGTSLSGYAAVERQLTERFVVGAKVDIDRADYYEPTIVMLYLRHVFGGTRTPIEIPPRPVQPYSR